MTRQHALHFLQQPGLSSTPLSSSIVTQWPDEAGQKTATCGPCNCVFSDGTYMVILEVDLLHFDLSYWRPRKLFYIPRSDIVNTHACVAVFQTLFRVICLASTIMSDTKLKILDKDCFSNVLWFFQAQVNLKTHYAKFFESCVSHITTCIAGRIVSSFRVS